MLKKVIRPYLTVTNLLFLVGTICWSLVMVRSGLKYNFGLGFWGANGHDSIWHISLAQSLANGSFNNPVFAGSALQNYHLGFDLLLALINQITKIPVSYLYFQILPPMFALGIGLLVYWFIWNWRGSKAEAFWATFFVYFSSSFGFIVTYLRDRVITGESMFWSSQSVSTLINPPFALSLIFILTGLIALQKNKKILAILFFGLLIQIKAYAGILVLAALLVSGNFSVFLGSLIISILIFLPFNKEATSVFIWQPFWFLETMMSYSDRLGWDRFYSAMTTYKMGQIWFKEILAYGTAFVIFIIGNMGLRIIAGISINFLNNKIKYLVVILAIFGTWATLQHYLPKNPQAKISNSEIEALEFLRRQPQGVVLTYPFDADKAKQAEAPRPLYLYESTSYVSAFSGKSVFLEDEVNLNIMGYDWKSRKEKVLWFISNLNQNEGQNFIKDNNISYLYLVKNASPLSGEQLKLGADDLHLEKIFENKESIIYKYGENFGGN